MTIEIRMRKAGIPAPDPRPLAPDPCPPPPRLGPDYPQITEITQILEQARGLSDRSLEHWTTRPRPWRLEPDAEGQKTHLKASVEERYAGGRTGEVTVDIRPARFESRTHTPVISVAA